MKSIKLYTVEYVAFPLEACDLYESFDDLPEWLHGNTVQVAEGIEADIPAVLRGEWDPEGWEQHSDAQWGEYRAFFWPSVGTIYRSRSAAQRRADLIESFGARARVLVTETRWESVDERRNRIAADKREKRIAALRAQIAAIEATA